MKYNVGDKFVIEIEERYETSGLYKVKGINCSLSERALDKLAEKDYREKYLESTAAIVNESYDHGLEDAWKIATTIYKSSYDGGMKGFEAKKYFGCTIDEIHKLPIQEVVKGFKHYEEDQNLDWSKVPVDTPVLVRDDNEEWWKKRYFAKYENGRVCTWQDGKTSWSSSNKGVVSWEQAKLSGEE